MRSAQNNVLRKLRSQRMGLAAKSWLVAILTFVAAAGLALPALRLSQITEAASQHILLKVLAGITNAAELDVFLERHRRLVESAPAEVDRDRLEQGEQTAERVEGELERLIREADVALAGGVRDVMPKLKEHRANVFLFGKNFAQDKAIETVSAYVRNDCDNRFAPQ